MCAYMPLKLHGISWLLTKDMVTQRCISRNVLQPALTTLSTVYCVAYVLRAAASHILSCRGFACDVTNYVMTGKVHELYGY